MAFPGTCKEWVLDTDDRISVSVRIEDDNYLAGSDIRIKDESNYGAVVIHRAHISELIDALLDAVDSF